MIVIVGDTTSFHALAARNFQNFLSLLPARLDAMVRVSYDAIGLRPLSYADFVQRIESLGLADSIRAADLLIVHGEGLLERASPFAYAYLQFMRFADSANVPVWLTNCCMYEPGPFESYLGIPEFIAVRDERSYRLLRARGLKVALAFDCSILSAPPFAMLKASADAPVMAIRGRLAFALGRLDHVKLNAAWRWRRGTTRPRADDYDRLVRHAAAVVTSSYHGLIMGAGLGIPTYGVARGGPSANPKFADVARELGLSERSVPYSSEAWREALVARTLRNVPST